MKFLHYKPLEVVSIRGFKSDDPHYDFMMTVNVLDGRRAKVDGMIDREESRLEAQDFVDLWKYLQENVPADKIEFEALPDHAPVYERFLPVVKALDGETFNNLKCRRIIADLRKDLNVPAWVTYKNKSSL